MGVFDSSFASSVAAFEASVPLLMKKMAEDWYKDNFKKGGWSDGATVEVWETRKRKYKHKTLVKTGRLRDSIKARVGKYTIEIKENTSYGKYHNKGNPDRGLAQRKFIGDSEALAKNIEELIQKELQKILK